MLQKTDINGGVPALRHLGRQVREARQLRQWSRKQLAQASGVSERFLAQLENGDGNISILRLCAIAQALGTTPAFLLQDIETTPARGTEPRRIALIGLRGAGKTTLGRIVARRMDLPFIELTDCIERLSDLSVAEIFSLYGNEGYRQLERAALDDVIAQNEACLLATAGGITEDAPAFETLLGNFLTVWLIARPDQHMQRVRAQGDLRPIEGHAQAMQALKAILGARSHDYARADCILDTSRGNAEQCATALERLLRSVS